MHQRMLKMILDTTVEIISRSCTEAALEAARPLGCLLHGSSTATSFQQAHHLRARMIQYSPYTSIRIRLKWPSELVAQRPAVKSLIFVAATSVLMGKWRAI